ncbi:MAG TPA: DUF1700 domain-containing protein [Hyphomonadaceae bacterium]|jgi:uncharacterized membrane protein|nr:DUF1700 domain-containing protein [Hyphomonadaceae bacterium]
MGEARLTFLATLRAGLRGAPPDAVDDIVADYASHFEVGAVKGRSEEDIATALGDPLALADELRVEMRIGRWQAAPSPGAAARLIGAVLGLGAINTILAFIMLPLACLLFSLLALADVLLFFIGAWFIIDGPGLGWERPGSLLGGLGVILAGVTLAALLALSAIALIGGLARYARLHYRLLPRAAQLKDDTP